MGRFLRSLGAAIAGITATAREERHFRFHLLATVSAITVGALIGLAPWEWVALTFAIAAVLAAELFNTAIERLADRVCKNQDPLIGRAKDCGAAATLVAAIAALAIGVLIFGPKILAWLRA
ncbi:MAG: diacylglycerol kinase family protein [Verrucomicrobiales bacterium]